VSAIYRDESETYEINLEAAGWSAGGELQDKFRAAGSFLNAVDWIAEVDGNLLLIEFKNYEAPDAIVANREKFYQNILRKYYFSAYYLLASGQQKTMNYILVAEAPNLDKVIGKRAQSSIQRRLPFDLQQNPEIPDVLIDFFKILSVSEWNIQYPMFPLGRC